MQGLWVQPPQANLPESQQARRAPQETLADLYEMPRTGGDSFRVANHSFLQHLFLARASPRAVGTQWQEQTTQQTQATRVHEAEPSKTH